MPVPSRPEKAGDVKTALGAQGLPTDASWHLIHCAAVPSLECLPELADLLAPGGLLLIRAAADSVPRDAFRDAFWPKLDVMRDAERDDGKFLVFAAKARVPDQPESADARQMIVPAGWDYPWPESLAEKLAAAAAANAAHKANAAAAAANDGAPAPSAPWIPPARADAYSCAHAMDELPPMFNCTL